MNIAGIIGKVVGGSASTVVDSVANSSGNKPP
jgi:hypothetical protein